MKIKFRFKVEWILRLLLLVLLFSLPATVKAQFTYTTNSDGSLNITGDTNIPVNGSVTIPETIDGLQVTSIGDNAFYSDSITSIACGTNVTSIGEFAFASCLLTNLSIPNSITIIGSFAFSSCYSLTNITIPSSLTNIGDGSFAGCVRLIAITVDTNNPAYRSVAGVVFNKDLTTIVQCPGSTSVFTIPASVTTIGGGAFGGCGLTSIIIPQSVTSIGEFAFNDCFELTSVIIPNSITKLTNSVFEGCVSLTSVTIPNSVTNIENFAFESCNSLTNIVIPGSVIQIDYDAFAYCINLQSVYFQGNAPNADSYVFSGDNNVTVYYMPGTVGWSAMFGGAITWDPQVQFGVLSNQFGFTIAGNSNLVVVIQACTNLANHIWLPVATNTLNTFVSTNGTSYFKDPQWTNYPSRFYRLRSP
jgi:hypothetical protein